MHVSRHGNVSLDVCRCYLQQVDYRDAFDLSLNSHPSPRSDLHHARSGHPLTAAPFGQRKTSPDAADSRITLLGGSFGLSCIGNGTRTLESRLGAIGDIACVAPEEAE